TLISPPCPSNRDMETVLREDREALRSMQKHQPRFTEDQKRELSQVHPWIRTGRLPRAINISGCTGCKSHPSVPTAAPFDVEIHEMELCSVLKAGKGKENLLETAMDEAHPEDDEEETEEKETETQDANQDMTAEEPCETSEDVKEKSHMTH
ncbi:period circadian protein homolog 2-like, partial [Plectropomus leopardus]|uniref:period circadian protein homolog 2-like n=1 Tax=Plectropomus leopardus TaxID=160734 RepID=UPI001C4BA20E